MYIYIYGPVSRVHGPPHPPHMVWGLTPETPQPPTPPCAPHPQGGEIQRQMHPRIHIHTVYICTYTFYICIHTHTCKCIYEQGPLHPPPARWFPPPVAGEGGFLSSQADCCWRNGFLADNVVQGRGRKMDHEGSGNMNKLRSVDRYIVDI